MIFEAADGRPAHKSSLLFDLMAKGREAALRSAKKAKELTKPRNVLFQELERSWKNRQIWKSEPSRSIRRAPGPRWVQRAPRTERRTLDLLA